MKIGYLFLFAAILISFCPQKIAFADSNQLIDFSNLRSWDAGTDLKPKTRDQVLRSYRRWVHTRNGVNEYEAKIIAQYELAKARLDNDYDISKPKVIEKEGLQWIIRFPTKFSLTHGAGQAHFLICVEKESGRINCFGPDVHKVLN